MILATSALLLLTGVAGMTAVRPDFLEEAFLPYTTAAIGSGAQAVAVGDLNGDGRDDVAVVTGGLAAPVSDQRLHVLLQENEGGLGAATSYPVSGNLQSVAVGDLDGDGLSDVVVGVTDGIGILQQQPDGTLAPMLVVPAADGRLVRIADLNGDGRLDVVAIGDGTHTASVFLQGSDGRLEGPTVYAVPHGGQDDLEVGDVNGDGRADVIVMSGADRSTPDFSVLYQQTDGTLGGLVSRSAGEPEHLADGLGVGDVTGDGRADVVVLLWHAGWLDPHFGAVFAQGPDGTLPDQPTRRLHTFGDAGAVEVADVNADGHQDVVAIDGLYELAAHRQAQGGFRNGYRHRVPPLPNERSGHALAVGDVSGDGRTDVLLAHEEAGLVILRQAPPRLVVTQPGARITTGGSWTVAWSSSISPFASFDVLYSVDGGSTFQDVAGCMGLPAAARTCSWVDPGPVSAHARIQVTGRAATGEALAEGTSSLEIVEPFIKVTYPDTGEIVRPGSYRPIDWSANLDHTQRVTVELSRDDGQSWTTLTTGGFNRSDGGSMSWFVTGPTTTLARVRVTWNGNPQVTDTSDLPFTINTIPVARAGPDRHVALGAPIVLDGSESSDGDGHALTYLWRDQTGTVVGTSSQAAVTAPLDATTYTLTVHDPLGATAVDDVVITSPDVTPPAIYWLEPHEKETLVARVPVLFQWAAGDQGGLASFDLRYSVDGGLTEVEVPGCAGLPGTARSCAWAAPVGVDALLVRLVACDVFGHVGSLEQAYRVTGAPTFIAVDAPARDRRLPRRTVGSILMIHWTHDLGRRGTVRIEVSRDGGATWSVIADSLAVASEGYGHYWWQVSGPATRRGRIRVSWTADPALRGVSARFAIGP